MPTSPTEDLETLFTQWQANPGLLDRLLDCSAKLLNSIIGRKLQGAASAADVEDVSSEALLELLSRLSQRPAPAIENFPGYLAGIAFNSVHDYHRRRHPERHKLKNRVRYALNSDGRFALWDGGPGGWLASLERYRHGAPLTVPEVSTGPLVEVLVRVLADAKAPVGFEALVDRLAKVYGIQDQQVALPEQGAPSPEFTAGWTNHITKLWALLRELPVPQRVALLLNLRSSEDGDSPIVLFVSFGIASLDQLAALLEMQPLELARLWNRLPLSDQELAERLQLSRQQIINLRMSARKRLARNLPEVIKELK